MIDLNGIAHIQLTVRDVARAWTDARPVVANRSAWLGSNLESSRAPSGEGRVAELLALAQDRQDLRSVATGAARHCPDEAIELPEVSQPRTAAAFGERGNHETFC